MLPQDSVGQVTPVAALHWSAPRRRSLFGVELRRSLGERLAPTTDQHLRLSEWVAPQSTDLSNGAASWWDEDEFVLSHPTPVPTRLMV
uniref:Uncharacterized protein n=1 Tax=Peronospora matthiolae TaxID=2874970 RepID=A0AAV1TP86_9STRA